MEDFGQLIVYLVNKDKLPDFKTTRSFWCTRIAALGKINTLQTEGNIVKNAYFNGKLLFKAVLPL